MIFLKDYILNNSLTALIPKTINRITIPTAAVQNKAEAILIGIKDDSPGNYLERFMGEKGFMHYAESLNLSNVTEEDVKKRIGFTVRNYSKWLNNSDIRTNRSTVDAILDLTGIIVENNGHNTSAKFLDMSKAFDSINHHTLFQKLEY